MIFGTLDPGLTINFPSFVQTPHSGQFEGSSLEDDVFFRQKGTLPVKFKTRHRCNVFRL